MQNAPRRASALLVLLATYVCSEVAFVAALVSGPTFQRVLGLSDTQLGMCLGSVFLGCMAMSLAVGQVTARRGAYATLCNGIAGLVASLGLILLAGNFAMLLAGLVALGVSAATLHNAAATLLSDIFPASIRRVMALASALWFGSSIVSSPLIGAWLGHAHHRGLARWGYGLPTAVAMALLIVCLLLVRLLLPWTQSLRHPPPARGDAPKPQGRGWMWILLIAFGHGLMTTTFVAWANPMIQSAFDADDFRGSLGFAAFAAGLAGGRMLLTSRHILRNDRALLAFSGIGGGAVLALSLRVGAYPLALATILVGAFAASATIPCLFSLVARRFPRAKSRLYGWQEACIALGGLAGPFAVGLLVDAGAPVRSALLVSPLGGALLGVGSLLWLASERRGRAPKEPAMREHSMGKEPPS